jgi:uridine phosphorylase
MSEIIIEPARFKGEPHIKGPCLFFVNPGESQFVIKEANALKAKRHFLFNSNLFELPDESAGFWAGPAMGAPMAVMTMEKLVALGATDIVVFGWCGSLSNSLKIGDVFLPTWGLSEEGTSCHYPCENPSLEASPLLHRDLVDHIAGSGYNVKYGPIWTTDAPYRETRQKVREYHEKGIMAVDMEFSALLTLACFRKVNLAAVMLVSDELYHTEWRPGFANKKFKQKSHRLFSALAKYISTRSTL